jgi:integrase/recombinase XerD
MLTTYKRHSKTCPHRTDRHYRRCDCTYWIEGTAEGVYRRESLKTRSYERAITLVREIEDGKNVRRTTVKEATDSFLDDAKVRGLRATSLYKYELLFRRLNEFADKEGLHYVSELDIEALRRWRSAWKHKNHAAKVTTANLRAFMRFCFESGWLKTNPVKLLKPPKVTSHPVEPFTDSEMEKIFKACTNYKTVKPSANSSPMPIKAFVLLLRWSGLRVADAVTLERSRLTGDRLFLYTQKTGTPVHLPLPPDVVSALGAIPNKSKYFFWTGNGQATTRVGNFQVALRRLFELAEVKGHAHKFRHTFAVSLLLEGIPVERVAILLGHSSSRVTSETYSPWIQARQDQVEQDVRSTWNKTTVETQQQA